MNRLICTGFFWLSAMSCAFAEQPQTSQPVPPPEYLYNLDRATLSIGQDRTVGGQTVFATAGSGVVIANGGKACLLTARHMFFEPTSGWVPTQVTLHVPPVPGTQSAGYVVQLVKNGTNLWVSPDDGSDLAVLPLDAAQLQARGVLPVPMRALGGSDDIYRGANVLVLGYPGLLGESYLSTPWVRSGTIAWDDIAAPTNMPFLVDANLYPGNSGGPVFHVHTGFLKSGGYAIGTGLSLIGIVSKGAIENANVVAGGVPIIATNPATGVVNRAQAQVLGIGGGGVIEPVARAMKILNHCLGA